MRGGEAAETRAQALVMPVQEGLAAMLARLLLESTGSTTPVNGIVTSRMACFRPKARSCSAALDVGFSAMGHRQAVNQPA